MIKYFVWIYSHNGPIAQIWGEDVPTNKRRPPLFKIPLDAATSSFSLDSLIAIYPCPKETNK